MDLNIILLLAIALAAMAFGVLLGFTLRRYIFNAKIVKAEEDAKRILSEALRDAESKKKEAILEAKEVWYKEKADFERETKERRFELQKFEKRLSQKEENIDKKMSSLEEREREITKKESALAAIERKLQHEENRYTDLLKSEIKRLETISGLNSSEAKEELMKHLEEEAKLESAGRIKKILDEAKDSADRKAKDIISLAMQRCAAEHVVETTVSVVDLPNDEMKGRIIGREGRNIRALEIATGIDLIIDDTPEAIILSGYDPLKREITRLALERLMADGRIHPGRIEDVVNKVKKEIETTLREEGEQAAFEVGVNGLHPEEIRLLGRLKFRTSYSQNVLQHSKEVAILCGVMASELGANVKLAKRAGLLHDIGKAVDHQSEGSHTQIGVELARKFNESKIIINAIAAHHEDTEPTSIEAVILQTADTLSAARPGARREMLETYIKRLEKLEEIGDSFKGVEKAYAIQAGREIRVMVRPEEINDSHSIVLARDIAKKIEEELVYPGEIKVTVIRETRAIEYAK